MKTFVLKKRSKGFSLVEVLLAIVLLAIVTTPLLQTVVASIKTNNKSKEMMASNDCSTVVMEYLESREGSKILTSFSGKTFKVNGVYDSGFSWAVDSDAANIKEFTEVDSGGAKCIFDESRLNSAGVCNNKVATYCPAINGVALSNVQYGGYGFDIVIYLTENTDVDGDDFKVYDVNVISFPVTYNDEGNLYHGQKGIYTQYKGSVFDKFK